MSNLLTLKKETYIQTSYSLKYKQLKKQIYLQKNK